VASRSATQTAEIARWLRAVTNETELVDRLDRMIDAHQGVMGVDREQAATVLVALSAIAVHDPDLAERLSELEAKLTEVTAEP
jgi:hypothetical protein